MHLIIGYGNTLRGDDAIGPLAAQQLEREALRDTKVLYTHQLTPELAENISQSHTTIFIDASIDLAPGEVLCAPIEPTHVTPESFTHRLTPDVLLAMSKVLYGTMPRAFLVTVGAASFEIGASLSEEVENALPEVMKQIRRIIAGH